MLIAGRFYFQAPDWDTPISIIMAIATYATAAWSMRVMVERQWRKWPLMLLVTWFSVDGCYWFYWRVQDPVALTMMREANGPASLSLYWMCGLIWFHRGTTRQFLEAVRAQWVLYWHPH